MSKNSSKNLLDHYSIESPCREDWNGMMKEQQGRFCLSCDKSVHDLSSMTQEEAFSFLETTPSPCVRYTIGEDGQVRFRSPEPKHRPIDLMGRWREYMARSTVVASLLLAGCDDLTSSNNTPKTELVDTQSSKADPGLTQDTIDQNASGLFNGSEKEEEKVFMGEPTPVVLGKIKAVQPEPRVMMGDIHPIPQGEE